MDCNTFLEELKNRNIDPSVVVPESSVKDGFVIRKNYYRWEIFFRERGQEYEVRGFPSKSDALENLLETIIRNKSGI